MKHYTLLALYHKYLQNQCENGRNDIKSVENYIGKPVKVKNDIRN